MSLNHSAYGPGHMLHVLPRPETADVAIDLYKNADRVIILHFEILIDNSLNPYQTTD